MGQSGVQRVDCIGIASCQMTGKSLKWCGEVLFVVERREERRRWLAAKPSPNVIGFFFFKRGLWVSKEAKKEI